MQIKNLMSEYIKNYNFSLSEKQLDQFENYYNFVVEFNKLFNLTAIIEENNFVIKHYIDSILGASFIPFGSRVCDIGAGGGFPSVPLAIMREDIEVVSLDSTAKKMNFVYDKSKEIGLNNITVEIGRAEEKTALFSQFDVVCARAVSSLNILLEICTPLLRVGGLFIAYKADLSELDNIKNALKTLNIKLKESCHFILPNGDKREIIVFEKLKNTPFGFPRQYGQIKKKPL